MNAERYCLNQNRNILSSLEDDQILFNPDEAEELFAWLPTPSAIHFHRSEYTCWAPA